MKAKKIIISLLLLFAYSLGFAHNIIPHQHDAESKEHIVEHDGHHHHNHSHQHKTVKHSHTDHQHISHGNHYDEDFYDLLVCFLHKADHQDDCKDQHFLPANSNRISINKLQANMLVAVLFSVTTETEQSELTSDDQVDTEKTYLSPFIEDIPLRGPPSNS